VTTYKLTVSACLIVLIFEYKTFYRSIGLSDLES